MKKLITMLSLITLSSSFAADLTHKFGIGANGGYPIPIWDNSFNDDANPKWSASVHGKYHFNPTLGLELNLEKEKFKDTGSYLNNINLLAFLRTAGDLDFTPVIGLGAGVTQIKNYVSKSSKLTGLLRAGVQYAWNPSLDMGLLAEYQYVSKILGDMPDGHIHVINPQISLTWYFGGDTEKKAEPLPAPAPQVTQMEEDIVEQEQASTMRESNRPDLTVEFDVAKADIKSHYQDQIKQIADRMNEDSSLTGLIEGHADRTGTREFNDQLSKNRALAVKNRLIEFGVDEKRLRSEGFGFDHPVADNKTEEGRRQNRRASVIVISIKSNLSERM